VLQFLGHTFGDSHLLNEYPTAFLCLFVQVGKEFKKMYDEINPTYNTIDEVPSYWRDDIRELVEKGIISGVGGGKLGLTHSDCKAAVLAKRIAEKLK
jgi:hypothetical protein